MRVAVIGAGGVGGYFGGKLAYSGYDVGFMARGEHLSVLRTRGLTVKSVSRDFCLDSVRATDTLEKLGISDLVILGIKAWQIKDIARKLKPILHSKTVILPLQNGIMAADELTEYVNVSHILGGACRIVSYLESPGVICHAGVKPTIIFGELSQKISKRAENLQKIFENSNIHCRLTDNIQLELWKKFMGICVSGLMAVTKTTYGELRENPETRQLMTELFEEIVTLSRFEGVNLPEDFAYKTLSFIDSVEHGTTASLARDVWAGKPTELDYQNGTVVKLAKKHSLSVPVNRFVYYSLLPGERKARAVGDVK